MITRRRNGFTIALRVGAVLALAITALTIQPPVARAARSLGLSSGTFRFDVEQGSVVNGKVIVSNDGDEPLKVMVYSSDQKVDDKGNVTYVAPTRADLSSLSNPSTWIRVTMPKDSKSLGNVPYMELQPGDKVPVKFSLAVPDGIPSGDHNLLLFFESFDLPKGGQVTQSVISGRLGARITLRLKGDLVERLEVRPFTVPAIVFDGRVPYSFLVRNTGNVNLRVGARALLLDRSGNEIDSQLPIDGRIVFAKSNYEATGTAVAGSNSIGPYKLRIDVTPVGEDGQAVKAGKDTITEIRDVWLVPLWLIIALGALVLMIVVRLIWSAAARSTRAKQEREIAAAKSAALLEDAEE